MLRALAQLMVLRVVVGLVYATSAVVQGKLLDLMVLALGQGMVMGRVAPSVLAQRDLVSISPLFLVQYYEMALALILER